jgi:hypothetical protein
LRLEESFNDVLTLTLAPAEHDRLVEPGNEPPVVDAVVAPLVVAELDGPFGPPMCFRSPGAVLDFVDVLDVAVLDVALLDVALLDVVDEGVVPSGFGGGSAGSGSDSSGGGSPLSTDIVALSMSAFGSASCSEPWDRVTTVFVEVVLELASVAACSLTFLRVLADCSIAGDVPAGAVAILVTMPR